MPNADNSSIDDSVWLTAISIPNSVFIAIRRLEMSSDSNALTYFLSLDELIQVIYQGSSRFVVISSVEESSWTVHLGLTGVEGRWWRGQWADEDIRKSGVRLLAIRPFLIKVEYIRTQGSGSSSASLEAYAGRLSNAFVQGLMHIGNWTTQRSTQVEVRTPYLQFATSYA